MYWIRLRSSALRLRALVASCGALEGDRAGPLLVQAAHAARDRGLAAAGLADQGDDLGLGDVEADVEDDLLAAVEDVEVVDVEDDVARLVRVGVGHGAAGDVPGADLAGADAADLVAGRDLPRARAPPAAGVDRVRATVVEPAAVGRAPGAGVRPGMPLSARAWLRCGIESSSARV